MKVFLALDVPQTSSLFHAEVGNKMRKRFASFSKFYSLAMRNKIEAKITNIQMAFSEISRETANIAWNEALNGTKANLGTGRIKAV